MKIKSDLTNFLEKIADNSSWKFGTQIALSKDISSYEQCVVFVVIPKICFWLFKFHESQQNQDTVCKPMPIMSDP